MSARFSDTARSWCCLAARLLGWTPGEFWLATPAELVIALHDPDEPNIPAAPSRDCIARMMERDTNG